MGTEVINWSEQFRGVKPGTDWNKEVLDEFIGRASEQMEPIHNSPEIRTSRVTGDLAGEVPYLEKLYSDDEAVTLEDRLISTFVASVAYGSLGLANEAYSFLAVRRGMSDAKVDLVGKLDEAMKIERAGGRADRLERLEAAAKALGKPWYKTILSGLVTTFSFDIIDPKLVS